jgi:diaminohydroxyphosphoribosylaminopyrimidine deaminase / 5-amino-6-(5-phosphoribosylamino)uracil reductase
VTLKIAQTLDGRIATANGHSRWVSGPASREVAHSMRAAHDAILVGIGTVLVDDPELTVRLAVGPNPVRVVVDSTLRVPPNAAVFARDGTSVIVVTIASTKGDRANAIRRTGADLLTVPEWRGRVDLAIALHELRDRGVQSVLVEGGAQIATEVIRRRLCDELVVFIAPKVVGSGIDAVGDLGTVDMTEAVQFTSSTVEVLDGDVVFRGKPLWPAG